MGTMRRVVKRVDPERLARQAAIAEGDARGAATIAATAQARVEELQGEKVSLRKEEGRLSEVIKGYPSRDHIQAKLAALDAEIKHIKGRISEIERELAGLEQRILERCRILATTVYRAYLGTTAPRQFDVVVIDEASMLMPPLVYFAAGLATKSVTVAGDFRQIAPIVMSDGPLAEQWLKRDVFRIAGVKDSVDRGQLVPQLQGLSHQYRMLEPICGVVNTFFYDGRLVTARDDPPGLPAFPFDPGPLLYVDTAELGPWAAFSEGTRSRYNLVHALLVRNIVTHLRDEGYLPADGVNERVGVVAPFRAQADLIQELLDERLGLRAAGIATTVHRFQGNEKHTMIIDLTSSTGVSPGPLLTGSALGDDGARLLNVALSRAKDHVVLVGDIKYLRNRLPSNALLRKVIQRFTQHGQGIDPQNLP